MSRNPRIPPAVLDTIVRSYDQTFRSFRAADLLTAIDEARSNPDDFGADMYAHAVDHGFLDLANDVDGAQLRAVMAAALTWASQLRHPATDARLLADSAAATTSAAATARSDTVRSIVAAYDAQARGYRASTPSEHLAELDPGLVMCEMSDLAVERGLLPPGVDVHDLEHELFEAAERWIATYTTPTVVFEDEMRWQIECAEPGCSNALTVGKRLGRPRLVPDADNRLVGDAGIEWTTYDTLAERLAAGNAATRCTLHPGPAHAG